MEQNVVKIVEIQINMSLHMGLYKNNRSEFHTCIVKCAKYVTIGTDFGTSSFILFHRILFFNSPMPSVNISHELPRRMPFVPV